MAVKPRIGIIGAGPGGLTAAMILANRGLHVSAFEKHSDVGGRNGAITSKGYTFDIGPTFLMMKFILDEVFQEAGKKCDDLLDFIPLNPMYELHFPDKKISIFSDPSMMKAEIEKIFPGHGHHFDEYLRNEKKRLEHLIPCLQKHYSHLGSFFSWSLIKSLPFLSLGKSVFQVLKQYFKHDELALSFAFQSKYLGMSAWDCPGAFAMLSYIEHAYGIFHVKGGLSKISQEMAEVAQTNGAVIHLSTEVKEIIVEQGRAKGVLLVNGEKHFFDEIIINADFGHAMKNFFAPGILKKYHPIQMQKKKFSCSTFMMYLGINKTLNLPHHSIYFADNYRKNVEEVFNKNLLSKDFSFYVRNASCSDNTLAPPGKSALYVLVPVPNLQANINWSAEKNLYKTLVYQQLAKITGIYNFYEYVETEIILDPPAWENQLNVYLGATFNLSHNLAQMAHLRPHNKFEEVDNCYLVGGGTHPGSGLPTIYESGRIAANMISKKHNLSFNTGNNYV